MALITLLMAGSLSLFSCSAKESRMSLFLYNEADPYIREFAKQILAASPQDAMPRKFDAGNSQLIQNEQIEAELTRNPASQRPALMMINPVDRLGAYALIQRLKGDDIPVIFFNREPLAEDMGLWDKTFYVGARAEQSGQLQAQLVMELFGGSPDKLNEYDRNGDGVIQSIILKGEQGHQDAEIRTREVLRSFEDAGFRVEVLALEIANWNRDEAYGTMGNLLRDYRHRVELIVSNNDAMALGAISRMRQEGLYRDTNGNGRIDRNDSGWIPVVGIDGLREAEESIAEGYLYGTVKNDSQSMATAMVELAGVLLGTIDPATLSYALTDGRYIWIDYRPFVSER
ncbi:MAG: galactose ABC transporter substrate-binding protein [Spirochaetales bacterium]|nr:galactose ABC transporter substrate-binding protein [Spirochaetales bacterium]